MLRVVRGWCSCEAEVVVVVARISKITEKELERLTEVGWKQHVVGVISTNRGQWGEMVGSRCSLAKMAGGGVWVNLGKDSEQWKQPIDSLLTLCEGTEYADLPCEWCPVSLEVGICVSLRCVGHQVEASGEGQEGTAVR